MIPYIENFYTQADADELFAFCKTLPHERKPNGPWGSLKRRLSYPGWSVPYVTDRKRDYDTYPFEEAPPLYLKLADRLSAYTGKPITYLATVGYEHERDGMNWHQDAEDKVREDQSVYVLSLGDEHLIGIRPHGDKNKDNQECFYPKHGSLYVLPRSYNTTHEHAVLPDPYPGGLRIGINCKSIPVQTGPQVRHSAEKYPDAVYVGRKNVRRKVKWPDTPWENYFDPRVSGDAFRPYAEEKMKDEAFRAETYEKLRGKDLLCPWCDPGEPDCHAKIWLELANS